MLHRWEPLVNLVASRFREFLREPEVIFWVYGFPLALALGLGFAFRGKPPEPPKVDVQSTPDRSRADELARRLSEESLKAEKMETEVHSHEDCERRLSQGKTSLYLIPHAKEIEYVFDPANAEGVRARYWVEAILSRHGAEPKVSLPTRPGSRYVHFLLPGLIGTNIMGGGLFGVGFVLVDMRVRKLFKRLMATPIRYSDLLLSLLVARLFFLLPEMTSLLLVGYFWFELPPIDFAGFASLCVVVFVGGSAFAGIGLLVGSRTEKTETASGLINLVMLPQYILSGVFFASSNFPAEAQPFIQALPLTQLIDAMREIMLEGRTLLDVGWRVGVLAGYAVVTFTLALKWFKWR